MLQTPIDYLKGVGPNRADLLRKELGIHTYQDLLNLFPNRYLDRTAYFKINQLQPNNTDVQIIGSLVKFEEVAQKRGKRLVGTFKDDTGTMELVWFRGHKWIRSNLKLHTSYVIFGKTNFYGGKFSMPHPEMELLSEHEASLRSAMQPIYPSTEKLQNKGISNRVLSNIMQQLFMETKSRFTETLSPQLLESQQLISKTDALFNIHFPKNQALLAKAQYRLKFEELFYIQLQLILKNLIHKSKIKGLPFHTVGTYFNTFYQQYLPFQLTNAQKRVLKEIRQDLGSKAQMNRLLQGDVGSGKTIVGFMTMLMALDNQYQACLMAPTEILATQHYQGLLAWCKQLNISIKLLTGSTKKAERKEIHAGLVSGQLQMLVGTHALLEDSVIFKNLGLAIIDEQHRFGVAQRSKLWHKGPKKQASKTELQSKLKALVNQYSKSHPDSMQLLKTPGLQATERHKQATDVLAKYLAGKAGNNLFIRHYALDLFVVDFYCEEKKLIIQITKEAFANNTEKEAYALQTHVLKSVGFQVIEIPDTAIFNNSASSFSQLENVLTKVATKTPDTAIIPPHILVMTATPIPRTLAMSVYGDLDVSVIDELPPGRQAIKTVHRYDKNRLDVFRFIRDEIALGRQVYIVYPLIQESEKMDYKDLMDGYESIARDFPPPNYQISIVHGQMKPADKDYEMQRFVKGETQIMVATTVIEVGVNVPNASVMIIESAERFGLSQLHQLRGRVGRGAEQSYCILMTSHKLSADSKTRLETMTRTNDGFDIAEVDLKLRGPGDIMGTQQSGVLNLRIADIVKDGAILKTARFMAKQILKEDPTLSKPHNQAILNTYRQMSKYRNIWNYIS
ncbi:helicase-related protein [Bizionia sediminis]|uniref:Probable DNA 3'-5' helicase RecG n=1 Tax=Bizionia sediminis TaxID=1737064 RepID=A0ABW5KW02_9FLAO